MTEKKLNIIDSTTEKDLTDIIQEVYTVALLGFDMSDFAYDLEDFIVQYIKENEFIKEHGYGYFLVIGEPKFCGYNIAHAPHQLDDNHYCKGKSGYLSLPHYKIKLDINGRINKEDSRMFHGELYYTIIEANRVIKNG
jgi:hypothetical protein